ncbi:hypothetical protein FEM48_Zijuj07G0001800 [Ziziphus jujuba var. spinosa]|uniref:Peptidase M10 metallopeptidase domain-containing protein n=1 Tax=Ziziphus jujuba var. spinosa TaxID=714518 RepID=A0A978V1A8_ZIZJJ|nr:hypothetical protein FEM48_Zijuj07G0001800 [Ziziphus jujuba var. spinosa]
MQPQPFFKSVVGLEGSSKGQTVKGIPEVRRYLNRFGYLQLSETEISTIDSKEFDEELKLADKNRVLPLESSLTSLSRTSSDLSGSKTTDVIDSYSHTPFHLLSQPVDTPSTPRSTTQSPVPNTIAHSPTNSITRALRMLKNTAPTIDSVDSHATSSEGESRWRSHYLYYKTYHISIAFNYSNEEFESALETAAAKWSDNSVFTLDASSLGDLAEIMAGLHDGFHGDDVRFDGKYGIFGHAHAPSDGSLHIDGPRIGAIGTTLSIISSTWNR